MSVLAPSRTAAPPKARPLPRFIVGPLSVTFSASKFILMRADRRDLPRLTISWDNRSGEVDIHLTQENRGLDRSVTKSHEPVFKFRQAALAEAAPAMTAFIERQFARPLLVSYRRFRPGWLARKGYVLFLPPEEALSAHFRSILPKVRGKYRVQGERITNRQRSTWMLDHLYSPRELNVIDHEKLNGPVQLIPSRRRGGGLLMLGYMRGPDGRHGWWGIRQRDLQRIFHTINRGIDEALRRQLRVEHSVAFEKIVAGLALDDIPGLAKAITGTRALMPSLVESSART